MLLNLNEVENLLACRKTCYKKIKKWQEEGIWDNTTRRKVDLYSSLVQKYDDILYQNETLWDSQLNKALLLGKIDSVSKFEDVVIRATALQPPSKPPVSYIKKLWNRVFKSCFVKRRRVLQPRN